MPGESSLFVVCTRSNGIGVEKWRSLAQEPGPARRMTLSDRDDGLRSDSDMARSHAKHINGKLWSLTPADGHGDTCCLSQSDFSFAGGSCSIVTHGNRRMHVAKRCRCLPTCKHAE